MTEEPEETLQTIEKMQLPELLTVTSRLIRHLDVKAHRGRLQLPDVEKMRDSKTRLLIEAIKTHGTLMRDDTIEDLQKRIAALEGTR